MNKNNNESATGFRGFPNVFWIANSIALVSTISLIVYGRVVRYLDAKNESLTPVKAELAEELN